MIELKNNSISEITENQLCISICLKEFIVSTRLKTKNSKFNNSRLIELQGVQFLLSNILGANQKLCYHKSGAPYIENSDKKISISHSKKIIAVGISSYEIGIDLEEISERVVRVKNRFMNEHELKMFGNSKTRLTLAWTIKESLFKISKNRKISFKNDLKILKEVQRDKIYLCSVLIDGNEKQVRCRSLRFKNHFLTYNDSFENTN